MLWLKPYQCLKQSAQSVAHHGYLWCRPMRTRSSTNRKMPLHVSLMPRKQSDRRTSGSSNPSCIELLTRAGDTVAAEQNYHLALAEAQKKSSKLYELRAATNLARLWNDQGKRAEARDLLVPIYGWFTEGLDALDLRQAELLLEELTQDHSINAP